MISIDKNGVITVRESTEEEIAKELERLRSRARHNEAAALRHARDKGAEAEREKWQVVVSKKDAALADKDAALADKDTALAEQTALIAELQAQLRESN